MKWIMPSVTVLVAAVLSVGATAQSGGSMAKGDTMAMEDQTFSGCIEKGSAAGAFALTHVARVEPMAKDTMVKDTMAKDTMAKDTMAKDTMSKDTMSKDAMAPTSLSLSSTSVDLGKHLGHKVSVTGSLAHEKMDAMGKDAMGKDAMGKDTMGKDTMGKPASVFTVKSLEMIATSCP